MVSSEDIEQLMTDRPRKYAPEDVGYQEAPEGSALRCAGCFHLYRRATDGHTVCELIRSEEIDKNGIYPDWRCLFFTVDGTVTPLLEETPEAQDEEDDGDR